MNTCILDYGSLTNRLKPFPQRPAPFKNPNTLALDFRDHKPFPQRPAPFNPPPHPLLNKHSHTHPRGSLPTPSLFDNTLNVNARRRQMSLHVC